MTPRVVRAAAAALCATIVVAASMAGATTGELVTFPSLDIDPQTGVAIQLTGLFFTPDPSAGGFPAVIALHGCDGMYSTLASRRDKLTARHQAMADLLVAEGYAVLFPDSFNPRGRREVCTQPVRDQTITQPTGASMCLVRWSICAHDRTSRRIALPCSVGRMAECRAHVDECT
jgi:poly(3-hydroxybutyrate) depolymerase